ncbi:hypothetical protein BCR42DRAFT_97018 [Absidia repens]|uniref:Uncharacterized protein n=1 Tax=Absidia repens TaxID=90262 RepID=A0A1X2I8T0_9FUNG|nr:hypothetical protein BCR42DRAFT_97018 [Absidia repens]
MSEITTPLMLPQQVVQQPTYSSITPQPQQEEEQQQEILLKDDDEELAFRTDSATSTFTFWKSKSYAWSLVGLVLLLITFTALEFALLKLNLPSVDPQVMIRQLLCNYFFL